MKTKMLALACLGCFTLGISTADAAVLFQDDFDRADATDIDTSSIGMSGSLAPLSYVEHFEGSGAASSIQVLNNRLEMANGAGMSAMYLDHNFIDAAILSDGGLKISLDIVSIPNQGDSADRFTGFGLGMSAAEAVSGGDHQDGVDGDEPNPADGIGDTTYRPAVSPGGNSDNPTVVTDFFVDLANDGNIYVWANGPGEGNPTQTINVGSQGTTGTLSAEFSIPDFNAGSTVSAKILFNGSEVGTQSFTWSGTNENYIGFASRSSGTDSDNLVIETIPEPASLALIGLGGLLLMRRR